MLRDHAGAPASRTRRQHRRAGRVRRAWTQQLRGSGGRINGQATHAELSRAPRWAGRPTSSQSRCCSSWRSGVRVSLRRDLDSRAGAHSGRRSLSEASDRPSTVLTSVQNGSRGSASSWPRAGLSPRGRADLGAGGVAWTHSASDSSLRCGALISDHPSRYPAPHNLRERRLSARALSVFAPHLREGRRLDSK